jgi:ferric-dicitrate binding protein FerR (iron transport regulator)/tetratricopeptide (TPR) repeat protein
MTHDEAIHLLSARIDGPLPAEQQQSLDVWLAESPDHAILAEAFQTQHGELRTAFEPRREAARATAATVARQLSNPVTPAADTPSRRWWKVLVSPFPAACAAAILIAIGLIVFRGKDRPSPESPPSVPGYLDAVANGLRARARPEAPPPVQLAVGDTVATKAGEKRRVTLPDGSFLYLNQNTTVQLPKDRHIKLTAGEVFLEAVPAKTDAERFLVETPKKSVTALGTKFAVTANDAGTGVLVSQGKVEVSGLEQKLTTGQKLAPGEEKIAPAPRASAALEWTRDLMVAAESPLVPAGKHSGGSLVAVDPYGQEAKLQLVKYHIDVHIEDGFARTTIDQTYFNSENFRMEGTFYFPLPPDASLSRLAMYVEGDLMEGGMAERDHARNVYETIRYQNRDPALLEWVDGSVFKMRVFPLEARQEKRIVLSYTQKLPVLYGQASYRFPAGHTLAFVDQWSFKAVVKDGAHMSAAAPSHPSMKLVPQGQDLVMADEAKNVKIDRDVVLTLHDHQAQANAESFRWSRGELDGQQYLMVRYRPDLPTAPRRERRDWVFLFESSGARDPLLARAQVEVIRSLLAHAEHDDTFAVLSVGTRIRKWTDTPQPAIPENVSKAVTWLEARHLVGALNLDQAMSDATPLLQAGSNPHLVHVGSGIASFGEQRADELVKRIPAGTRYVGIGVGKRVSPAFMKVAAERTGGLFTQVNPDEPISWRGFEIASTLNAPRLLNVRVETPGLNGVRFLNFSNSLAHGEELAAVANVTHAMPRSVTVRGILDGQAFERVVPVSDVADHAGYLPRTWAKLEIDRLLAEDSNANRKAVTELSKAMYVMTPFTSLLVLESEQMYKDFKVDRGRKDHWAMYPCPEKIPVVYIPDPNQPAGTRPDLKGQKPHENAVLQTIIVRTSPQFLTWPGRDRGDNPVVTAGQRIDVMYAVPQEMDEFLGEGKDGITQGVSVNFDFDGADVDRLRLWDSSTKNFFGEKDSKKLLKQLEKASESLAADRPVQFGGKRSGRERFSRRGMIRAVSAGGVEGATSRTPTSALGFRVNDDFGLDSSLNAFDGYMSLEKQVRGLRGYPERDGEWTESAGLGLEFGFSIQDAERRKKVKDSPFARSSLGRQLNEWGLAAGRGGFGGRDGSTKLRIEDGRRILKEIESLSDALNQREEAAVAAKLAVAGDPSMPSRGELAGYFAALTSAPQYYGRPSFNGNHRVFTDLVAYAPGMSSSRADVRAVLEAEAAPRFGSKRGSIDPVARKIIDAARTADWKALRGSADDTKPAFIHDGQGRYAYERRVAFGLLERVVCDGTHLWHLYPEIGVGAKRSVSRFHRAPLSDLIPDFVPLADDLTYGADLKAIDDHTVAQVPILPPRGEEKFAWIEVHFVFNGPRLAERRWVLRSDETPNGHRGDLLFSEVYEPGVTRLLTAKGKELEKTERFVSPAPAAPDLKPDVSGLVVLPLPLRNRDTVYRELDMEPSWDLYQEKNACFEYLDEDSAMRLLASEFAANNGSNVYRVWNACFEAKGDRRTGFFTLMAAANHNPRGHGLDKKFEANPSDSLVRYLWQMHDENIHNWQAQFGFAPGAADAQTFLGKLTTFRRIYARWQGGYIHHDLWGQRDRERERTIAFATRNADNVLGWCTLAMVQDRCPNSAAYKAIADAWGVLAEKSALRYPARYEEARCLGYTGKHNAAAQEKYQALFRDALKEGVLPPLDSSFRSVLESGEQDAWAKLMRETAARCAEKKARPVIVTLAWQCYQLGDVAMADTLLDLALEKIPADEKAHTGIAAVHFLNGTSRYDRADQIVRDLLSEPALAKSSGLWRLASQTADNRRDSIRGIECLERALDIEYDRLPDVFDVQPIRNDYGRLLGHYEWLADASASLKVVPPKDLVARVVKAADRWRHLDPEASEVPNRVAAILRKAGGEGSTELAWDYVTTPLATKPNESSPWTSLAWSLRQEGNWRLADKCYEMAFAAEPTNAQLLWDRAQHLQQQGQIADSRALLRRLADSEWQPRFNGLKAQARQAVEGR